VIFATVPEAAVNEDRHACPGKYEIGGAANARYWLD
jgi:hypothetical protein